MYNGDTMSAGTDILFFPITHTHTSGGTMHDQTKQSNYECIIITRRTNYIYMYIPTLVQMSLQVHIYCIRLPKQCSKI